MVVALVPVAFLNVKSVSVVEPVTKSPPEITSLVVVELVPVAFV